MNVFNKWDEIKENNICRITIGKLIKHDINEIEFEDLTDEKDIGKTTIR